MFFQEKFETWMVSNDRLTQKVTGFVSLLIVLTTMAATWYAIYHLMSAPDEWWGIPVFVFSAAAEGAFYGYYRPRTNPNCKVKINEEMMNVEYVIMTIGYQLLSTLVYMLSLLPIAVAIGALLKFLFTRH